jgi:hypothetical protein
MLEINQQIPHSLGPVTPSQPLLDLQRIDIQVGYLALCYINNKGQLVLLRIFYIFSLKHMLT